MTQIELIDRLCAVNTLLTDIVREQAEIMAQHGVENTGEMDKKKRAELENDLIEAALHRNI